MPMSMMKFTKIDTSIHDNPSWRNLESERDARLAYFGIIAGCRTNYSGFFYCRVGAFACESMFAETEVPNLFEVLQNHGLIEYDRVSSWIRVNGWYYGQYAPQNASEARRRANFYLTENLPAAQITNNSISEFVVGSLRRAASFKPDSKHALDVYTVLSDFIRTAIPTNQGLLGQLENELQTNGK